METFISLEKKLNRLSQEMINLKELKKIAKKEYKEAEDNFLKLQKECNLKKSEISALKSGLEYLYEKKLDMIAASKNDM